MVISRLLYLKIVYGYFLGNIMAKKTVFMMVTTSKNNNSIWFMTYKKLNC